MLSSKTADIITTSGFSRIKETVPEIYPHGFENFVIVVENNTTTTATALQRIFKSPIIYIWLLFIVYFVVIRCGLQCLYESETTKSVTKRRRCVFMCQDTVLLSCGVVMHTKLFKSSRYRHALLAHGATIIPLIAGMFISGLLYGDYLIHSQIPNIDSIEQLEQSDLRLCVPFSSESEDLTRYIMEAFQWGCFMELYFYIFQI